MIKRICGIIAAVMCVSCIVCGTDFTEIQNTVNAVSYGDTFVLNDLEYSNADEDDDGTYDFIELMASKNFDIESVEIPEEINGLPVKKIHSFAFFQCEKLKSVTLPDSLTDIGVAAFKCCYSLKKINIPDSVKTIGDEAFGYICQNDEDVKMDDFTIYGKAGTTAEAYAKENGFKFIVESDAIKGDANMDGKVDVRDCAFIAKALATGKGTMISSNADFNDDNKVDVRDAAAIARFLATKK